MNKISHFIVISALAATAFTACKGAKSTASAETSAPQIVGPAFQADSAYAFCAKQCEFGPRTMNSEAHDKCRQWIVDKFRSYGMDVEEQKKDLKGWDGTMLRSTNIIARFKPEAEQRILLCAHWDTRPWSDNDPDEANWHTPVMGANDGASGVAVMIEIARLLQKDTTLNYGIDFVCFDAEDYGTPQWESNQDNSESTWALGAQEWARQIAASAPKDAEGNMVSPYEYGILLDMVGGEGSRFYQEGFSLKYASRIVSKVWSAANDAGVGSYFVSEPGGFITDDHNPINEIGIPCIDIIPYYPDCKQSSFGPTWHTINDDMEHIDRNTLHAVGQTVIQTLFN